MAQTPPLPPHALERLPGWHLSPSQQPLGHEALVQPHLPPWQAWPVSHLMQVVPPVPQAPTPLPATHLPPSSQQPLGQLLGVQAGEAHLPVWHFWSLPHCLQLSPPTPQFASVRVVMQFPWASQQPLEQVEALQACLTQDCCWQAMPLPQSLHDWPDLPQAPGLLPGRQAP